MICRAMVLGWEPVTLAVSSINDFLLDCKLRRRAALESDIEELAFSISEIGLLNPITLTGDYTLIADAGFDFISYVHAVFSFFNIIAVTSK